VPSKLLIDDVFECDFAGFTKNFANAAADFFVDSSALACLAEISDLTAVSFGGRPGPRFSSG
jgi:hypothetical protein